MDSDSGLPQSPTLEEDDCQELNATPRPHGGPAVANWSMPGGGNGRETSARIDVETLAREVEDLLSQSRKQREIRKEEDDQFEYATEHGLLSRELSLESPEQPNGETRPERTPPGREKGVTRPRTVSDYQQYWRVGVDRTRQTKTADKYRLSFVELSDSSEGEEEEVHTDSSHPSLSAVKRATVVPLAEKNGITSNKDITSSKGPRQSLPVELLSLHDSSFEQLADMQYDDEGMDVLTPPDYAGLRLSSTLMSNSSLPNTSTNVPSHQSYRHHPLPGSSTLMYDDEDLDFLLPSAEELSAVTTAISKSHTLSVSSESPKKTLSYHSSQQSTVVTPKVDSESSRGKSAHGSSDVSDAGPHHAAPRRVVPTQRVVDHSSSPLHKMSTAQLQYMVQLLETKLQGTCCIIVRPITIIL